MSRSIALALSDLNKGIVHPILDTKKSGRSSDLSELWVARARVCGALLALVKAGMTFPDAASRIAIMHHKKLGSLCGKKSKRVSTTILSWHSQLSSGKVRNFEEAEKTYDWLKVFVRDAIGTLPESQRLSAAEAIASLIGGT